MKYIIRNQENKINLKLSSSAENTYSGTYIFNLKHIQTENVVLLTETDISTLTNRYQQFIITSGDSNNLETGQYLVKIYDIDDSDTVIFQDIWNVDDVEEDDNTYFFQTGGVNTVYDITGYTNAVPSTPVGFSGALLSTGIDINLSWLQGSTNTNSFDLWRKKDDDNYLSIQSELLALRYRDNGLSYDSTYKYKIRAENSVGFSDFSDEVTITTAASGDTGITATYTQWTGETVTNAVGTYLTDQYIYAHSGMTYTDDQLSVPNITTSVIELDTDNTMVESVPGLIQWNEDDGTIDIGMLNDVVQQVGLETYMYTKNQTGDSILNGKPVMFDGAVGVSGIIKVKYALASIDVPAVYTIGIATQTIENGEDGYITTFGKVRGINTTGDLYGETWVLGDVLYVSQTTEGALTNVPPQAPYPAISIAAVVTVHSLNGELFIRPTFPAKLTELSDVNGTPVDTDGQIPTWHDTEGYFDFDKNINDYLTLTGGTINGDLIVAGDFYNYGTGYTTHTEKIVTKSDYIIMREDAVALIPTGQLSGLAITKADGVNNVLLGADNEATMRVGWSGGTLQAIATREDNPIDGGITFWNETGNTLQTDSNLFWDDVNNKLGIGTIAPSKKLSVNAGASNVVALFQSTDTTSVIQITDVTDDYYIGTSGNKGFFGSNNSLVNTNLTIDNTGNVGIGTTAPTSKLTIDGDLEFIGSQTIKTSTGDLTLETPVVGSIYLKPDGTSNPIRFTDISGVAEMWNLSKIRSREVGGGGGTFTIWGRQGTAGSNAIKLTSDNGSGVETNRLIITGQEDTATIGMLDSNVGIGTTAPTEELEVIGTAMADELSVSDATVKKTTFVWNDTTGSLDLIFN